MSMWEQLKRKLQRRIDAHDGIAGVCVKDLVDGSRIAIAADEEFVTASTIKAHILVNLLARAGQGEFDLARRYRFTQGMGVGGSGVLWLLDQEAELALIDLANLMIVVSDNSATNFLIDLLGMEPINAMLDGAGLHRTRLRRKMMDHPAARQEIENTSTPAELVALFELLHGRWPAPQAAEQALAILKKPKDVFLNRAIPKGVAVAHKPGYSDGIRADAGIVYLPRRPYAVAIMQKYGLGPPDEQDAFVIELARTIYQTLAGLDACNALGHIVFGPGVPGTGGTPDK